MRYFEGCYTVESVKARYRELAMKHHPDRGGDTATMQDVNAAYHSALGALDGAQSHDAAGKVHTYKYNRESEEAVMGKVAQLLALRLPDTVEVWIIGVWVWIVGTTRQDTATRESLKGAGCVWHSKRCNWYWRAPESRHWGKASRGGLADLANKYGARNVIREEKAVAVA